MSYVPPSGQPMGYPMQPPPPKKKSKAGLLIAAILGVMLFLCCGGFSVWALATADEREKESGGVAEPSTSPTPSREKDGASKAKIGQCINVYSLPAPTPTATPTTETSQVVTATERVPCGTPGGYQVLKRFDATTSGEVCSSVTGATSQYVADQSLSTSEDFVLCLKKQ
jgi:hypothetical protein